MLAVIKSIPKVVQEIAMKVQGLVDTLEAKIQVIVQDVENEIKKPFQVEFEVPTAHIQQMCDIETRLMQLSTTLD